MISFEEAYKTVLSEATRLPVEEVPLTDAQERILAGDIVSDSDMPPFDKAAVDGYAICKEDLAGEPEIIETIPAGKQPVGKPGPGQCMKIMTGAMVPEGTDYVVMVEDSEAAANNRVRFTKGKTGVNICFRGEDIKRGEKILEAGIRLQPQHLAILASAGVSQVPVSQRVRIGILSTGDELVEPGEPLSGAKIRNSNSYQLSAQVTRSGGMPVYYGIAGDQKKQLSEKLTVALEENDIVLATGGVSMGDLDFVPEVFRELGIRVMFHSISIQPGRPTLFGKKGEHYIFGLPGNPVSSFVLFEILVKPFMIKMMGGTLAEPEIKLPLGADFIRRKSSRKAFIPVKIINGEILPVEYHGSGHIHAYSAAGGIITMESGVEKLEKGNLVHVRQI